MTQSRLVYWLEITQNEFRLFFETVRKRVSNPWKVYDPVGEGPPPVPWVTLQLHWYGDTTRSESPFVDIVDNTVWLYRPGKKEKKGEQPLSVVRCNSTVSRQADKLRATQQLTGRNWRLLAAIFSPTKCSSLQQVLTCFSLYANRVVVDKVATL